MPDTLHKSLADLGMSLPVESPKFDQYLDGTTAYQDPALVAQISALAEELRYFKRNADSQFEDVCTQVLERITDFPTARASIEAYDVSWFASLPFTERSKSILASRLIAQVSPYISNPSYFWDKLASADPETVLSVMRG